MPVGQFRFTVASGRWLWSPEVYAFHGFAPGEVVPTSELMRAHQHPEDRDKSGADFDAAVRSGEPFSFRYRLLDGQQKLRTVVVVGEGVCEAGVLVAVRGYFIDVTAPLRKDVADATADKLDQIVESRAAIENAKGALRIAYSLTDEEAFAVLCWHSQHGNIKLRDLAAQLMAQVTADDVAEQTARRRIGDALADVAGSPLVIPPQLATPASAIGAHPSHQRTAIATKEAHL